MEETKKEEIKKVDSKVVGKTVKLPEPGDRRLDVEEIVLDNSEVFTFNKNTVLYLLYLQYKNNMITRSHLKNMFKIINAEHPSNLAKWLVDEAAKG